MKEYDYYIFDMDGTVLDTLDDLADAVNYALKSHSMPLRTKEEVCSFVGNGILKLIERSVPNGKENAEFNRVFEDFKEYYGEHCEDKTAPYDGIISLLTRLNSAGKKCAIVSNKADFAVKKLSEKYFGNLVYTAIGENEEGGIRKKPAPDSVFSALQIMGGNKENAVYIGDSDVDIQTAENARIDCISVLWGFRNKDFLSLHGAKVFASFPKDIF